MQQFDCNVRKNVYKSTMYSIGIVAAFLFFDAVFHFNSVGVVVSVSKLL